jgi:hypothetical protein
MNRLLPFRNFESEQNLRPMNLGGCAPFEFYGEQSDHIYKLRVNPSQELFDVDLGPDNGGVVTGNTDDIEGLSDKVKHLENGAVYDWVVKCINDTSWFYRQLRNI